ncbi:MAG: hypothetical protein WBB27_14765 [Maribacter sp.]
MKRLFIFIAALGCFACEDVIEIETPAEPPRLSVDGIIRVKDSSTFTNVQVKVSLTSSFFEPLAMANIDQIKITNIDASSNMGSNSIELIEENPGSGIYENIVANSFLKEGRLELTINYENNIYVAQTQFVPTVPIQRLEQGTQTLFGGDEIEIIVAFDDDGSRDDFYIFDFDFDAFLVTEDEFYQGERFEFSYFYDNELSAGQEINVSILGADLGFYNYMNQIIVQSGGDQGPFQTPSATVRGNIINARIINNMDASDNFGQSNDFVLGYFAVVQEFSRSITIE